MKRAVDFSVALCGLIVLSPVLIVIAGLIRWKMGSPIFFRQVRPGLKGRPFKILKFRTMRHANAKNGNPLTDLERLTSFGRFIRSSSMDELPELWNVLKGEMSLVGPRPLLMEYLPLYSVQQARRHDVRPGITGWAQINGRNSIGWEDKFELDIWYVENRTMLLDLKILLLTVGKVFRRDGISADGQATVEYFQGTNSRMKPTHCTNSKSHKDLILRQHEDAETGSNEE